MGPADSSPSDSPSDSSSDSSSDVGRVLRRQRRSAGGRSQRWCVRASDEDAAVIQARAGRAGVSVPRLLVSLGVGSVQRSAVERKATVATLVGLRRQLAGVGTNLNQLAYHVNAVGELGEVDRLDAVIRSVEELASRLETVLGEVEGS